MAENPFTKEDVQAAVEQLVANAYLDEVLLDRDGLTEIVQIVLTSAWMRGRLLPPSARLVEEIGVRVDRVHPRRPKKETLGHVITHFPRENALRAPEVWDGWTVVKRPTIKWAGPWVEVLTDSKDKDSTDE